MLRQEQDEKEEEFQEADILWPDVVQDLELAKMYYSHDGGDDDDDREYSGSHCPAKPHKGQKASSPIDIPGKSSKPTGAKAQTDGFSKFSASRAGAGAGGSSLMIGSHVFMPPHVIVDRRAKRDTAILMVVDVPKGRRVRAMVMLE